MDPDRPAADLVAVEDEIVGAGEQRAGVVHVGDGGRFARGRVPLPPPSLTAISTDSKGRLWVAWSDGSFGDKQVYVARSNRDATASAITPRSSPRNALSRIMSS